MSAKPINHWITFTGPFNQVHLRLSQTPGKEPCTKVLRHDKNAETKFFLCTRNRQKPQSSELHAYFRNSWLILHTCLDNTFCDGRLSPIGWHQPTVFNVAQGCFFYFVSISAVFCRHSRLQVRSYWKLMELYLLPFQPCSGWWAQHALLCRPTAVSLSGLLLESTCNETANRSGM